jgi:hypothetical protein
MSCTFLWRKNHLTSLRCCMKGQVYRISATMLAVRHRRFAPWHVAKRKYMVVIVRSTQRTLYSRMMERFLEMVSSPEV